MKKSPDLYFSKVCLVGVGFIGGSLIQALRKHNAVGEVVGVGRGIANLQKAQNLGVIDTYSTDVASAVKDCDIVIIATPVATFSSLLSKIKPVITSSTIITDVGSVKSALIDMAQQILGDHIDQYVPTHPIAGGEKSGVDAAFAGLYIDHTTVLTPISQTRKDFIQKIERMWQLTGAKTVLLSAQKHDKILAMTSHLPHVIVFSLMEFLAAQPNQDKHFQFAAGGLYDMSRTASSDSSMWRDICLNNKENISNLLRDYASKLNELADTIMADDGSKLTDIFEQAKLERNKLLDFRQP